MVAPAFQWFRSRLVQNRYGEGGAGLNKTTLSQLNGLTSSDQFVIRLGGKHANRSRDKFTRLHSSVSNRSLSNDRDDHDVRSTSRNRMRNAQSATRGPRQMPGSRKFGELMIVKEKPPT